MIERKVQTYTTNESGQKIVTYKGQGLGERKLVIQKNGRTVSGTYSVIDATWIDKITSHTSKWWLTQTGMEQTVETDGILLNNPNTSSYSLCWTYLTDNFPPSSTARNQATVCWETGVAIEFDVIDVSSTSNVSIQINDNGSNSANDTLANYGITGACHVKLVCDGNTVKSYINRSATAFVSKELVVETLRFGIRVNASESIKYDNLCIYPI